MNYCLLKDLEKECVSLRVRLPDGHINLVGRVQYIDSRRDDRVWVGSVSTGACLPAMAIVERREMETGVEYYYDSNLDVNRLCCLECGHQMRTLHKPECGKRETGFPSVVENDCCIDVN